MKCDRIRPLLADYAVGGLRGRSRVRVGKHVEQCAQCRAELAALQRTGDLISRLGLESAPAVTWPSLCQRITAPVRFQTEWDCGRRLAFAGLALVVLVVALITFGPRFRPDQPEAVPLVQLEEEEMQASLEGHLAAVWSTPLADAASVGLRLDAVEDDS